MFNKNHSPHSGKSEVNIPEKVGAYPEVLIKDILRGELSPFRNCYDVTYYDLSVALNIKKSEKNLSFYRQRNAVFIENLI